MKLGSPHLSWPPLHPCLQLIPYAPQHSNYKLSLPVDGPTVGNLNEGNHSSSNPTKNSAQLENFTDQVVNWFSNSITRIIGKYGLHGISLFVSWHVFVINIFITFSGVFSTQLKKQNKSELIMFNVISFSFYPLKKVEKKKREDFFGAFTDGRKQAGGLWRKRKRLSLLFSTSSAITAYKHVNFR